MNYPSYEKLDANFCNTRWVKHVPVISTAHITQSDGSFLRATRNPAVLDSMPEQTGHLIRLHGDTGGWPDCVSEEFIRLISAFRELGYRWIILDRDGDKIEGLTTFDW